MSERVPIKHGLYVKSAHGWALRSRKVQRLVERLQAVMPWLEQSDLPACRAWAELEILSTMVFAELYRKGILNGDGKPAAIRSPITCPHGGRRAPRPAFLAVSRTTSAELRRAT
jgi:hypothetical protein